MLSVEILSGVDILEYITVLLKERANVFYKCAVRWFHGGFILPDFTQMNNYVL